MREIKFRLWNSCGQASKYFYSQEQVLECLKQQITGQYNHEADGSTFEQFTGLRDKNGREIYEGDIIRDKTGISVITFNPLFASFCIRRKGWYYDHFFGEAVDPYDVEVIGNIHENPELLD